MGAILAVAVITSTGLAMLAERIAYRPFRRVVGLAPLICAIGVSFFLQQTFRGLFGSGVRSYPAPAWSRATFHVGAFTVPFIDLLVITLALIFMAILYVIVQRTRLGTAMRAVAEDAEAAALMGIDVNRVIVFTFMLGGAMAGIAGVFYAFLYNQVYFYMGFTPGIKAFGAAVLGGIGSIPGAMLGGFFLGLVESVGAGIVPRWPGHHRPLPVARRHRLHLVDHGADLPTAGIAGRAHGEEARMSGTQATRSPLGHAVRVGLVFGVVGIYLAMVGLLILLNQRAIVVETISLGHAVLLLVGVGAGLMAAPSRAQLPLVAQLGLGVVAGTIAGAMVALLTLVMSTISLQYIFIALSPALLQMLTLGEGMPTGPILLVLAGALTGLAGALLHRCPAVARRPVLVGFATVVGFGVFQELIQLMMQGEGVIGDVRDFIYTWEGLSQQGAITMFIVGAVLSILWQMAGGPLKRRTDGFGPGGQQAVRFGKAGLLLLLLILLPLAAGSYIGQVLMLVGLYILMGMGLNLEIGLAGLLDLGFVAFFAVGAYVTALLTADSTHALAALNFWEAMPIAVLCSVVVGIMFGIPVLGVRGDYLAVATMGLGEIVRVIVASDFASPLLGGAQGVLQIPKPNFLGISAQWSGAAVLSDARLFGDRGLYRLAVGEFTARPGLDGVARR